jgi:exoribonuclease R
MIGILSLKKSYGRQNGKMLYKFFPKDESPFLVPYSIKSSFSKANEDLYVICENRQANTQTKYDIGTIKHCIGSVNDLHAYYEYELYRKNLIMGSNTFFQKTKNIDFEPDKGDEDRFIFTIDSTTTTDFDDAISIHYEESCPVISVYISNVPYIMEKFGLWAFVEKVSTVYLPDKKRGMLPYPLENACSLKEGCYRHVYVMEIRDTITFSQKCVKISKNYIYEEPSLKALKHYKRILSLVQDMATRLSFDMEIPRDSYGLIVYLMIFMNYQCAMKLENGIFRKVTKMAPREQPYIFATWMNWFGEYVCEKTEHEMLGVFYTHVTSPIRRLVDIVNLAILQNIGSDFCIKWLARIDFINEKTKSIKKVQRNCELMKQCMEGKKEYDAFGMENCIYIPELKMLSKPLGILGDFRVKIAIVENKEAFKKVKFFISI